MGARGSHANGILAPQAVKGRTEEAIVRLSKRNEVSACSLIQHTNQYQVDNEGIVDRLGATCVNERLRLLRYSACTYVIYAIFVKAFRNLALKYARQHAPKNLHRTPAFSVLVFCKRRKKSDTE